MKSIYRVSTIEEAEYVSTSQLRAQLDITKAIQWHEEIQPPSNGREPYRYVVPTVGDWRLDPASGECAVFLYVPICDFEPSEQDWEHALRLDSTQRYIAWLQAGHTPPPLALYRTTRGNLRSSNRRRWLAARAAGVDLLPAWYAGPAHPDHVTRGVWYLPEHSARNRERYNGVVRAELTLTDYFTARELDALRGSTNIQYCS